MRTRGAALALGVLLTVALLAPGTAVAASEGTGLYVGPTALPWVENQVTIDVALGLARGEVHQRFWNNTGGPVEAIYVFPLPTGAVVTGMSLDVAGTHLDGIVAPRPAAVAAYERAIAGGRAVALTERERPGVYTQSIAGIPAGGTVVVTLRWQARLTRHQGEWELAHPLVVGPRYTPGAATGAPTVGAGTSPDTDRAPDASRITPPRERAATTRFVVTATLHDAGAVSSPTHTLALGHADDAVVATIDDPRGNRELVLRWRRAGLAVVRAFAEPGAAGTYVAVMVEPPATAAPPRHTPRSWLIAIDRSASMQGAAAAQARRLAHAMVASLGPGDRAAVVAIGAAPRWLGADAAARATLDDRIDHLPTTTGDLTAGLAATLARLPATPPAAVVLITDGLVADDAAAIARASAARAVVHPVGVGAAPNRWLLEAIAAGTGGSAHVAIDPDDAEVIAAEVVAAADAQPVAVDWRRPSVTEAEPGRAVVVPGGSLLIIAVDPTGEVGRAAGVAGGPAPEVEVMVAGARVRAAIELRAGADLATEWARQRITRLEASGQGAAATRLALERGLVSSTTALVAIGPTQADVVRSTVTVPLPLPAGLRPDSLAGGAGDVFDATVENRLTESPVGGNTTATGTGTTAGGGGTAAGGADGGGSWTTDTDRPPAKKLPAPDPRPTAVGPARDKTKPPAPTTPTPPTDDGTGAAQDTVRGQGGHGAGRDGDRAGGVDTGEAGGLDNEDANTDDEDEGRYVDRAPTKVSEATTSSAPATGADADFELDAAPAYRSYATAAGEAVMLGRPGGRGLALSVGLGARVDEVAPAGQLSLALARRLGRTGLFTGLRLDVTGAPSADRPLSAALLVTLVRHLGGVFVLDAGLGPAYDGRAGLGYAAGLTLGRGPLGLGLRLSGAATTGPDAAAVTGGLTVGF